MIIGKVFENGQVIKEKEFETAHDAIKLDYILWSKSNHKYQYEFYYKGEKIDRIGGGFVNEIEYLKNMLVVIAG